jgi:ABC-type Fe3+/spermidine/putrescine transport system ATPase subunit
MRMIAGLLAPTRGDIRFDDRSVLEIPPERRGAVMVFQKHLLFPHMSVAENVGFGLKMRGVDRRTIAQRVSAMLAMVQLPGYEQRRAHELSGGQQQRVALARALVIEPAVLLLDEPLANLDANLRLEMRKLIRELQQTLGITTIFVTHDQEEAVMLADRIALLIDGQLQQYSPPELFYTQPATVAVARFFRNGNFLPGEKRGNTVRTVVGPLAVNPATALPDGPVLVTVRPEQIMIVGGGANGENCIDGVVQQVEFLGAYQQLIVELGGVLWTIHAPIGHTFRAHQRLQIMLPPQHLWCLPAA